MRTLQIVPEHVSNGWLLDVLSALAASGFYDPRDAKQIGQKVR